MVLHIPWFPPKIISPETNKVTLKNTFSSTLVEENLFFRVTSLVSGEIVFGGDHGMWRTIAYAQCILSDTVGFRRSFWIIRYFFVRTTRPLVSLYCCTAVVGSPLSRCFRRYRPYPRSNFFFSAFRGEDLEKLCHGFCWFFCAHSLDLFLYAKSVFVLGKDGILYFIILRSDGFLWSP